MFVLTSYYFLTMYLRISGQYPLILIRIGTFNGQRASFPLPSRIYGDRSIGALILLRCTHVPTIAFVLYSTLISKNGGSVYMNDRFTKFPDKPFSVGMGHFYTVLNRARSWLCSLCIGHDFYHKTWNSYGNTACSSSHKLRPNKSRFRDFLAFDGKLGVI